MSSTPPAPSPTSPPSPPSNSTKPPPANPSTPPPSNSTATPPATPSEPPPSNSTAPAPATPSTPPPATPSAPPPATPSAPKPATPSAPPPPATPSAPPPATPSAPPSSNSTSPPAPATPSVAPPVPSTSGTPSSPSPPTASGESPPSTPSPPSSKTPPSAKPPPSPPSSSGGGGISTTAVVGIAVGAVVILAVLSILFICCRKKRRRAPPMEYYGGPPPPLPPRKDDPYGGQPQNWQHNAPSGGQPQNWQHNAPPPVDHVVKIPPQPAAPPPHASRPPHPPAQFPPPPPPPPVYSSGGSGSNYSGSEILPPSSPGFTPGFSKSTFTFEELALATNGFSDANLLGQGGFGYVHKGVLPNGKEVAIKQLKSGSGQGEREFQAEVEIISRVHHRHLVSLVGYCISGEKRLLVYEYVPNKTLEFHLHGKDRPTMEWSTRLKIALGSAKGLAYLHEDCHPKIIHRDIKAANILLDDKFDAKVADFGLAKFASDNNTHVSTRVMGTFGYLAPEYASSGKLTDRSDVFSYGVMLLELITGKRPVDTTNTSMDDSLVDWARPLLTRAMDDGNYDALIDPRLGGHYNPNEMARMVACAGSCVRHSARRRPRMSQIVRALEGDVSLEDLNEGIRPGHSTHHGSYGSSEYDSGQYNEDMRKFRKMALASRDYASSEYSAPTSEYGQIPSASSSEGQQTREMEMGKMKKVGQGFSSG